MDHTFTILQFYITVYRNHIYLNKKSYDQAIKVVKRVKEITELLESTG